MHELSIACSLIQLATETASEQHASRVSRLNLRIGVAAGVIEQALRSAFELAAEGTLCEGAEIQATVDCSVCATRRTLAAWPPLICPICGTPAEDLTSGRELELMSMEIHSDGTADS